MNQSLRLKPWSSQLSMNANTKKTLDSILEIAARDRKEDYRIYDSYQRQIQRLDLSPKEYESAIIKLSKILKV